MGDRGNICIKEEQGGTIFLYSHWGGSQLPEILQQALIRGKERWDDEAYLARIIFNEMTAGEEKGLTGFGISTYETGNKHLIIYVSTKDQTVTIDGRVQKFKDYIKSTFES